jgi:cell division protein FtsI (penicillin-binding protein 3)
LLRRLEHWGGYSIASVSMGQEVGVTPLQMVNAVSSIANGGLAYKPHVVQEMRRGEQVLPLDVAAAGTNAEPKRVIRPETAATLRRLMEGVILKGTGKKARLDGWTAAGKTGTAQKIDPGTGRYSAHNVIASFTGFAPINDPSVTILVSLDSPGGWPHDGGSVAAPVFKRIAEQVLAYLDVPRDVPLSPQLVQTAYKREAESDDSASLEDFTPVDFSAQTEPPGDAPKADVPKQPEQKTAAVTMAVDEGGDIPVPDFAGKTMREVTEACLRLGLNPVVLGSGLATQQSPAVEAKVRRGAKITVQFGGSAVRAGKAR